MANSSAFHSLHPQIQRFLWAEQWESLRDVQERTIPEVLRADQDVVVAASTASGKTEAAFLPALTHLLNENPSGLIIYVSPLKALINDQFGRLDRLCEMLDIDVWPWHGDISSSSKQRFFKRPAGVLLITPESLEALLCNRGTQVAALFQRLQFLVVDELHAFIGSERGKQLQSLMFRIEAAIGRRVPRIGLSATLGDMASATRFLRIDGKAKVIDIPAGNGELQLVIKGFEEPQISDKEAEGAVAAAAVAQHIFQVVAGSKNLVFPNSRREVERYTHLLNQLCEQHQQPRSFWPHHGNLSKEIRSDTETALKQDTRPATAICTNTLELGIDIGAVKSVIQIGPPPSVASLRQRMGRSGRRKGEPAIIRGYSIEQVIDANADLATRLRLSTVQSIASVLLLVEKWYEPANANGLHLSTLIQQLLSLIAQYGGLHASQAFQALCSPNAPFHGLARDDFVDLLRHLGQQDILIQDSSGLLLHGPVGERIVNHYSFYAAFAAEDEFRLVAMGRTLGTLPVNQLISPGQRLLFGGRTWLVEEVDEPQKTIYVAPAKGGTPPLFNGNGGRLHTRVRETMRAVYRGERHPAFLDATAQRFLQEGQSAYAQLDLDHRWLIDLGSHYLLITWLGDAVNDGISCLLDAHGHKAQACHLGVELTKGIGAIGTVRDVLKEIAARPAPAAEALLATAKNLTIQKWDGLLPPKLLMRSYASLTLDMESALEWIKWRAQSPELPR